MSKVLGIVAEYNPFHNGHLYHLQESKKITGCDYSIAIVSGNFTQRGSTSIVDKWAKAKMAIQNGVDLVIELPVLYSISSAETFADGSIKILDSLGVIDYVSFGAETADINILNEIADVLSDESIDYKNVLNIELKKGLSFPKARENALVQYLDSDDCSKILSSPNNILGIEYLKALKRHHSHISPVSLTRFQVGYNDTSFNENVASSTAIRELIKENKFETIKTLVPFSTYAIVMEYVEKGNIISDLKIFEKEIIYILRKMSTKEISYLPDVSEGLESTIKNAANSCNNIEKLLEKIKSKRYTWTRIQRILLYALLGITKKDMEILKVITPYIRILGFNENGKKLISEISKKNTNLKLITSVKKFIDENEDENLRIMFEKDILATNIYSLKCKTNFEANYDFSNKIIIL